MTEPALIELEDVRKIYRHRDVETHALNGVSMACVEGEFAVLRGPSGCGKSTLLSVMGLLDSHSAGTLRIVGVAADLIADDERARIRREYFGFVFQNYNLVPQLTALENVLLALKLRRSGDRRRWRERAQQALDQVGLIDRARHFPDQLSGGQQQRVCVARALVGEPKVIFADEPTGNLDQANGEAVMALLTGAHARGTTIVLVTHDARYDALGSRVIHMRDGRIERSSQGLRARATATKP